MNKTVKGSLAGAAGIALLMGGFGSYALWQDSENLDATQVQSGHMTINTTPGAYDDTSHVGSGDWSAGDLMVPGDVITYTQTFTVTGTGENLHGTISLANATFNNGFNGADPSNLTRTIDITSDNADVEADNTTENTSFTFDSPFDTAHLTAVVTYTFASVANQGTTDQDKSATTPATQFTIAQN
jgi:alternate signal-mediated exported protein